MQTHSSSAIPQNGQASAPTANDVQVGGTHYKSVYQHWDWAIDIHLPNVLYACTKYLARWQTKYPTLEEKLDDLKKAEHYLQKAIEKFPQMILAIHRVSPGEEALRYYTEQFISNNLDTEGHEARALRMIVYRPNPVSWIRAKNIIHDLIIAAKLEGKQ